MKKALLMSFFVYLPVMPATIKLQDALVPAQQDELKQLLNVLKSKNVGRALERIKQLLNAEVEASALKNEIKKLTAQPKKDPIIDKLLLKLDAKTFQEAYKNLDIVLGRVQAKSIMDLDRFLRPLPPTPVSAKPEMRPLPPVPTKSQLETPTANSAGKDSSEKSSNSRGSLLDDIKKGKDLKPVSERKSEDAPAKSSGSLFDEIKKGKVLVPVSERKPNDFPRENKPRSQEEALKDAIDKRRKDLQEDDSDDSDDSGDWD